MSLNFIDEFLDLTATLPREIVRYLKLIKEVDEKSYEVNKKLAENRKHFKDKLKQRSEKMNEHTSIQLEELRKTINSLQETAMSLSETKQSAIKEINYLLFSDNMQELNKIITNGQKECQAQQNISNNFIQNSTFPYINNKQYEESYSYTSSVTNNKKRPNEKTLSKNNMKEKNFIGKKKNRNKEKKLKKINTNYDGEEYDSSYFPNNASPLDLVEQKFGKKDENIYCSCKKISSGTMIACDNPECKIIWYHCACVNIPEKEIPDVWYCPECEEAAKHLKDINHKTESDKKKKKKK